LRAGAQRARTTAFAEEITMDESKIKALLARIAAPSGEGDLVSSGIFKDFEFEDGELTIVLRFSGVDRDSRHAIEDQVVALFEDAADVEEVYVEVEVADLPPAPAKGEAGLSVHGGGSHAGHDHGPGGHSHGPARAAPTVVPKQTALSSVKHLVAVASGKGGVGKSTVAVNLALALKNRGARVGIVDIDIYGPSVPLQLGVAGAKPGVSGDQKRFVPVEAYGLSVMSIGFLVDDDTPVIWRGPIVSSVVKQFLDDVEWGVLDYLVIDLPPGTGDAQLTLTQSAPITGALIVTTPSELALVDAVKGLQMFRKVDTPVLGIVENMSHFVCPTCNHESHIFNQGGATGGTERVAEKFGTKVVAKIPIDTQIQRGGDEGKPVVAVSPESPQAKAFLDLADTVIAKLPFAEAPAEDDKKKGGFLSSLFKR
jgi:ATP-binding protein involved in chromosome partitioning